MARAAMGDGANATGLAPCHGGGKSVGAHLIEKRTADRHKGIDYDVAGQRESAAPPPENPLT